MYGEGKRVALLRLSKKNDQLYAHINNRAEMEASLVWARPSSAIGSELSVFCGNEEVAFLEGVHVLDEESRKIALEELSVRYFRPRINKIIRTDVYIGNRYFRVDTDCGIRSFVIKNPYMDIKTVHKDGMLINDVLGNLYLIPSFSELDKESKVQLEKVI